LAWSFQEAAFSQILQKLKKAKEDFFVESIYIAGGVAQNLRFRELVSGELGQNVFFAPVSLCSDNATMIALAALFSSQDGFTHHPFPRYTFKT